MRRRRTVLSVAVALGLSLGGLLVGAGTAEAAPAAKKAQVVRFSTGAPTGVRFNVTGHYVAKAHSSSGLPVVLAIAGTSKDVCSGKAGSGGLVVTWDAPGVCTVRATQAGSKSVAAAGATQSFAVGKATQKVTFTTTPPPGVTFDADGFYVAKAKSSFGLPVKLAIAASSAAVCFGTEGLGGLAVKWTGPGVCTVRATQTGTKRIAAAGTTQSFQVGKAVQETSFTSTPPTGITYDSDGFYVATAGPAAGAPGAGPSTITVDPASSAVCSGSPGLGGLVVTWSKPGTCTLHADQAGDAHYAPAKTATQSFTVGKETTTLTPAEATKGLLGLGATKFSAVLERTTRFGPNFASGPFAGQTVSFAINGTVLCTAVTDADGVATCSKAVGLPNAGASSYTASFAGTEYENAATATGVLK